MSSLTALIDADVLVYRIGFSCQVKGELSATEDEALIRLHQLIDETVGTLQANEYKLYLTGGTNYRMAYNKQYKANRDPAAKPIYYDFLRGYLLDGSAGYVERTNGIEADDAMAIEQSSRHDTVICSIDKDFLQVPGNHYNFVKKEVQYVTELEGLQFFYKQLLIGDNADNVTGVYRVGPVKAARSIDPLETELDMFECVQGMYDTDERLIMNALMLWLQRTPGQLWTPPEGSQLLDEKGNEIGAEEIYSSLQEQTRSRNTEADTKSSL